MKRIFKRRTFLKTVVTTGVGLGVASKVGATVLGEEIFLEEIRIGIVGLAVHSAAFSQIINDPNKKSDLKGCRITALYHPPGNPDVDFTKEQLDKFEKEVVEMGVKIAGSMDEMLELADVVLIETNDGRPHMDEVMPALEAKKPVFVDKPVAESLENVIAIYEKANMFGVPIFSSSSLRYIENAQKINQSGLIRDVLGANAFSPAPLESSHTDLFWYGIHGVELLYTVMGTGCQEVMQVKHSDAEDVVIGYWEDGRIGTFRGIREGKRDYGGTVFLKDDIVTLGSFEGYRPLAVKIVEFFVNNKAPVASEETIEIYAFMEAAQQSAENGGKKVKLETVLNTAKNKAH